MKYKVIDNFLDEEYFNELKAIFIGGEKDTEKRVPWFYFKDISYSKDDKRWKLEEEDDISFFMTHLIYDKNMPISSLYDDLIPLLEKLKASCLMRIKTNLYPNTHKLREHVPHTDYAFPHSGALLSLNTCDGYTKLKDGTKIDSVANRVLLFDPGIEHCSTSTTNVPARFNININYIQRSDIKK